ncbi:MAG: CBS domain-containing protein [Gemmatimonadota bacterium]
MQIREILDQKGRQVVTVRPGETVRRAARLFVTHGLGVLPVVEDGRLRGILSERDALRVATNDARRWAVTRVSEAMTREVFVVGEDDAVEHVMDLMTRKRIRHVPVVEEGELRGLVSIGDVVKAVRGEPEGSRSYRVHRGGADR